MNLPLSGCFGFTT